MTESDFDKCFNVNVKGVYFGTAAFIPRLLKQAEGGVMLNIASVGATRPRPGLVWYNASKGAVWNVRFLVFSLFGIFPLTEFSHRLPRVSLPSMESIRSGSTRCARFLERQACKL